MSEKKSDSPDQMDLTIPIFLTYDVLQSHLKQKMIGEILHKENDRGKVSNYAEVLNITLTKSLLPDFDLLVTIRLKTLTFLYRNKELDIDINARLHFDNEQQQISVDHFEIDSRGGSWIADQVLESVVNKFMYEKLKKRLSIDLLPQINEQLSVVNDKLASSFEPKEGIAVSGSVDHLVVEDLAAKDDAIWIFLRLEGWAVVEITEIKI